ncbi:MAG TPA: replication-relaxation family protein, partial [Myxococcales bacterium]
LGTEPKLPAGDISASFLEHCVRLNDLLVALVATGNAPFPSVRHLPFRWLASDSVRLPWRDYDRQAGIHRARIIQPDATLEVPAISKRYFLECEMGTQPLLSEDPSRAGATAHKLDRYSRFMSTYVDAGMKKTAYAVVFPDRWSAQLVFLLNSPTRRDHVRELFEKWGRERSLAISVQALTFDEAISHFRMLLGSGTLPHKPQPTETVPLTRAEHSQLGHFFTSATRRLHRARDQVKELKNPQLELPDYPSNTDEVLRLLKRLSARFTNQPAP